MSGHGHRKKRRKNNRLPDQIPTEPETELSPDTDTNKGNGVVLAAAATSELPPVSPFCVAVLKYFSASHQQLKWEKRFFALAMALIIINLTVFLQSHTNHSTKLSSSGTAAQAEAAAEASTLSQSQSFAFSLTFTDFFIFEWCCFFVGRSIYYFALRWQYYLIDFCYYATGIFTLYCAFIKAAQLFITDATITASVSSFLSSSSSAWLSWVLSFLADSSSSAMFHDYFFAVLFAALTGPVLLAIMPWRISFVPHSFDKVSSVFFHFVPALAMYTIRWNPDIFRQMRTFCQCLGAVAAAVTATSASGSPNGSDLNLSSPPSSQQLSCGPPAFASADFDTLWRREALSPAWRDFSFSHGWGTLLAAHYAYPLLFHLVWQLSYSLYVYRRMDQFEALQYETSFRYLVEHWESFPGELVRKSSKQMQHYLFIIFQLIYTLITLTIALPCFYWQSLHALVLAALFIRCCHSGANYYFSAFPEAALSDYPSIRLRIAKKIAAGKVLPLPMLTPATTAPLSAKEKNGKQQ